jgi:hypothetical protein
MNGTEDRTIYSGFAQFPDRAARDRFVRSTLESDPDLAGRAFLPETQPTIVFQNLTASQRERIRSALEGQGRWFDDVQFQTMS